MTDQSLDEIWKAHEVPADGRDVTQAVTAAGEDEVVCRECGGVFGQITHQHLQTHGLTLAEYREVHPEAPIYPDAPSRSPGREPGFEHTQETIRKISDSLLDNPLLEGEE